MSSSDSSRPDRGLVVKCRFDNARKKISFSSAQNCTFADLKRKVDRCFALSAASYTISWQDDYGETAHIYSDDDLTDAISYFCSGDDAPSSSGSSIFSGFGRGKDVVINVNIMVDYDGPSLSDTSSLASLDEYRSGSGSSQRSFSFGGSQSQELDDDAVTVSSKDMFSSASSSSRGQRPIPSSSTRQDYPNISPTIRYPNNLGPSDSISILNDGTEESQFSFDNIEDQQSSQSSLVDDELSHAKEKYPADPSAVFERLKIREALGEEISDWDGSEEDRGARWLREQHSRGALGGIPESPSGSSDDDDGFDGLSLERNTNGQYYYNYTDGSQLQDDERSRLLSDDGHVPQNPISERMQRPRPTSMHINWVLSQQQELEESTRLKASASQTSLSSEMSLQKPKLAPVQEDTSFDLRYYNLPAPPSDIVTDCSNCGILLESFRYVCSTCGEKPPFIKSSETKALDVPSSSHTSYPPRSPCSSSNAGTSPSQTLVGSTESLFTGTRKLYQNLVDGQSLSSSFLSSFSRPDQHPTPIKVPEDTQVCGYELCPSCLEDAGNAHAIDAALGSPSSSDSNFGRSAVSLTHTHDPSWRTAAPKKGRVRHAYLEKMWGEFGWEHICQDELVSVCSICSATTDTQRYKCAICQNFNLCSGCFTVVHLYHPAHPFILVPDKPTFNKGGLESLIANPLEAEEEISMEHRVTCAHCLMPIVGALFHCAICESVDICSNCEAAGLPGNLESVEGGHNSSHILLKIPYVMEPSMLRKASKAAMKRWRGRDSMIAFSASRAASDMGDTHTQLPSSGKSISSYPESPDDHDVSCSSCSKPIIGVRYQCCHCPSYPTAYNLCSTCEKKSWAVHDPMHAFFKLQRPVTVALQSRGPFLPPLYQAPAGPAPATRCDDPEEYLQHLFHWVVRCDLCVETIQGAWYRCAYCSKDLCHQCQTVDVHAPDHVFVVFKAPVELSSFKDWTSVENPKPIIDYPIY